MTSEFDPSELEDETAEFGDETAWVHCPYCGERVELVVDPGGGPVQEYVEDCEVCCRPWHLTVRWDGQGNVWVEARTDDE